MRGIVSVAALALLAPARAFAQPGDEPAPSVDPVVEPVVEPAPVVPAAPDDIDLASLGIDPSPAEEHLNLYGFADVSWRKLLVPGSSLGANYFPKENTFLVGNLNLYATKKLSRRWSSLVEIRFLYAPQVETSTGAFESTTAPDPADLERPIEWGGISIERVYLQYEVNEWLTVRAGSFLTPYGIWNVDHGSPAIISVGRPYIIGESLFPQQQTGLELYGARPVGDYQLRYHATLSNGRGPFHAVRDLDENKAIGARVDLETPWLDGVHIGVSAYRGRYTNRPADVVVVDEAGVLVNTTPPGVAYDETSFGADILVHHGPLHLQAEVIGNSRRYLTGQREITRGGFQSDGPYWGAYALAGYRFDRLWQVMPFAVLELDRPRTGADLGAQASIYQFTGGLNFRPDPSVVLKLQYGAVALRSSLVDIDLAAFSAQAAWAF